MWRICDEHAVRGLRAGDQEIVERPNRYVPLQLEALIASRKMADDAIFGSNNPVECFAIASATRPCKASDGSTITFVNGSGAVGGAFRESGPCDGTIAEARHQGIGVDHLDRSVLYGLLPRRIADKSREAGELMEPRHFDTHRRDADVAPPVRNCGRRHEHRHGSDIDDRIPKRSAQDVNASFGEPIARCRIHRNRHVCPKLRVKAKDKRSGDVRSLVRREELREVDLRKVQELVGSVHGFDTAKHR